METKKERTISVSKLVAPLFWYKEYTCSCANNDEDSDDSDDSSSDEDSKDGSLDERAKKCNKCPIKYWKLLQRPLREVDLCVENEREWAVFFFRRSDKSTKCQKFEANKFVHDASSDSFVYHYELKFYSTFFVYRTDSFAFENDGDIYAILVPCSESEIFVIQTKYPRDHDLDWNDIFPHWQTTRVYHFIPEQHSIPITDGVVLQKFGLYRPVKPMYDSKVWQELVVLKVDLLSRVEALIPFKNEDWRPICCGANDMEHKNAKYVDKLKAFVTFDVSICYVVLQYTKMRMWGIERYYPWIHFNECTLVEMKHRAKKSQHAIDWYLSPSAALASCERQTPIAAMSPNLMPPLATSLASVQEISMTQPPKTPPPKSKRLETPNTPPTPDIRSKSPSPIRKKTGRSKRLRRKTAIVVSSDSEDATSNLENETKPKTKRRRLRKSDDNDKYEYDGFVVSDAEDLQHYGSDDVKTTKHRVKKYNPLDDTTISALLDLFVFKDQRTTSNRYIFYNKFGVQLYKSMGDDVVSNSLEFVCTPSGEIVYASQTNLYVFWCQEEDGTELHAPGKATHLVYIDDDDISDTTNINITWLKTSEEYRKQFAPDTNKELQKCYVKSSGDSFPVDISFCAQFTHLSQSMRENLMMDYFHTFQEYIALDGRGILRRWSHEKYPRELHGKPDRQMLDMHDLLELYHIQARWLWRSAAGRYIWTTFMQPNLMFGQASRIDLVEKLMNATSFELEPYDKEDVVTCDACNKKEVVPNSVALDNGDVFSFGCVCIDRARYFFDIGEHIRSLRSCKNFAPERLETFIPYLIDLQAAFYAKTKTVA